MWRDYSRDYIRNNRTTGLSIVVASFIAALFLSILCSLFYNFWLDGIAGTKQEDGDWHARITGELTEDDLTVIRYFSNVERAEINPELSDADRMVVDVHVHNLRTVYEDMTAIVQRLGLPETAADYNYQLLSLYFVRIPGDEMPRLLMPAYLALVALVCVSLILVIHNSFAVSMNNRVHQFGIFSSIGATPGQIRTCLLQEALLLSLVPIVAGILIGLGISALIVQGMSAFAATIVSGRRMAFGCHPALVALILLLSVVTVLVSAWFPARRLSRLTPLEAIRGTGELQVKMKKFFPSRKHSPVLSAVFGMEGELAGNALRAQRKALRTTSLSLTLAFSGFMLMLCMFTLTGISTNHTYFERYQDAWDVMVTVEDTGIGEFAPVQELKSLPGQADIAVYQKARAVCILPREMVSDELAALGGPEAYAPGTAAEDGYRLPAPLVILDDKSFEAFCAETGIAPRTDGVIVYNLFWDSAGSNFRYPEYVPYVREELGNVVLQRAAGDSAETAAGGASLSVLACTGECPLLREEYAKGEYPLVLFLPQSLWAQNAGQIGGAEPDTYIRALAEKRDNVEELSLLEDQIKSVIGSGYEIQSENRIQERLDNDAMIRGYELILGGFCVLIAIIGIAHVFSNTLGFLRQRKREFARYMSIGVTPGGIRKLFGIEALTLTVRPVFIALVLTTIVLYAMIRASYLDPAEFLAVVPAVPILSFILVILGFVALAYYLGGRKLLAISLAEALRDDTML